MSGHSKWATIKRQKGAADAKRGQAFTKLANAITIAVRQGGGITDSESNFKLRLAIDKARAMNMPKDNIERAVERGAGGGDKGGFEEVLYEGFLPGGVAVIVEAATDNRNRTTSEVKNLIEKNGGNLGTPGSVSYLFDRVGEMIVRKGEKNVDDILTVTLDAGVEDVSEEDDMVILTMPIDKLAEIRKVVEQEKMVSENAEIVYKPKTEISIEDESIVSRILSTVEKLDEHDDVQNVFTNLA